MIEIFENRFFFFLCPLQTAPGRPNTAELKAMALRQQQQIDTQHQLLAAKEQRLRFLKNQEIRNATAAAEGERLRRLKERVEAQESKLRRLRALRGQVDLQKTYNVTLGKLFYNFYAYIVVLVLRTIEWPSNYFHKLEQQYIYICCASSNFNGKNYHTIFTERVNQMIDSNFG